jgi:4-hydroxy-3-methylbut-2-enyl diphosphate reductase
VKDAEEILNADEIRHLDLATKRVVSSHGWLPQNKEKVHILISAGASCPDAMVESVISKISSLYPSATNLSEAVGL